MAELKNCRRCNKIYAYIAGLPICSECVKEEERIFDKVSIFIRDHPGVKLTEVAEELDISYEKLMKYVKEGRLQIKTDDGGFVMFCEKCGAMISKGRFCKGCENHITNVLEISQATLVDKLSEKSSYKFYAKDQKKK